MNNRIFCVFVAVCMLLSQRSFATGKIAQIRVDGSSVELTVETTPGESYQVQRCDDLVSGLWNNIEVSFQASTNLSVHVFADPRQRGLFRVLKESSASAEMPPPPSLPPSLPPPLPPPGR